MKNVILILTLILTTISYGQKKTVKSIDQQAKEYIIKFEKLNQSQKRQESNRLVNFLNNTEPKTKGIWLAALEKYGAKDKPKENKEVSSNDVIQNESQIFSITTFSSIPDKFAGCSVLFGQTKVKYKAKKFLYFDDMGTNAIISINGKIHFLNNNSSFKEGEDEVIIYSNDEYSAYIHLKKYLGDSSEESQIYSAELLVKSKNGQEVKVTVYGEGGC